MTHRTRCAVCGKRFVVGTSPGLIPRTRRGPEGLPRCMEHLGEPLPEEDAAKVVRANLDPVEGEDYIWAVKRTYEIHYSARATATWTGRADDSPSRPVLDANASEPEIVEETHRSVIAEDRYKAWADADHGFEAFDEEVWREQRLEDLGLHDRRPSEKPRPEETLEAFA